MITIIKQLFKKYQLEIIRPNLDYVINKYQSAIDGYDPEVIHADLQNQSAFSTVKKHLIDFKHSPLKKRKPKDMTIKKFKNIIYDEPRHHGKYQVLEAKLCCVGVENLPDNSTYFL